MKIPRWLENYLVFWFMVGIAAGMTVAVCFPFFLLHAFITY